MTKVTKPKVEILHYTPINIIDRAISTCWDKECNMDEPNKEKIDRVVNKYKHACYSDDTEVLTHKGWINISEVSMSTMICTLNPDTNNVEYKFPNKLFRYDYSGDMIHFKGKHIDLLVTPNHMVYVSDNKKKVNRNPATRQFGLVEANNVKNDNHLHTRGSNGIDVPTTMNLNLVKLLGFFIGDGTIHRHTIEFNIRKKRKKLYLVSICEALGYDYKINSTGKYIVSIPKEFSSMFRSCVENKEKVIPNYMFFDLSKNELEAILDGWVNADGDYKLYQKGLIEISTTSKAAVESLSRLAVNIGKGFSISHVSVPKEIKWPNGSITPVENIKPCYIIRLSSTNLDVRFNNGNDTQKPTTVKYDGVVYCVEVPNHILMVRRGYKHIWSGNSTAEHSLFNFYISNISRALLQELARHRIASFSVKSSRYTLKELKELTEPLCNYSLTSDNKLLIEVTNEQFNIASKYIVYTGDLELDKKGVSALEQLRLDVNSNKPNDLTKYNMTERYKTELTFSINVRSLKNFIQLRSDKSALWEIRNLAHAIYDALPEEYTFLFEKDINLETRIDFD